MAAEHKHARETLRATSVLGDELITAHPRTEVEVNDQNVRVEPQLLGDLESLLPGACYPNGEVPTQSFRDDCQCVRIVFDEEHPQAARFHPSDASRGPRSCRSVSPFGLPDLQLIDEHRPTSNTQVRMLHAARENGNANDS
jgi:hypothetical protein